MPFSMVVRTLSSSGDVLISMPLRVLPGDKGPPTESRKDPILTEKVHAAEQTTDRKPAASTAVEPRQTAAADGTKNEATMSLLQEVVQRLGDSLPVGPWAHLVVRHNADIAIKRSREESRMTPAGVGSEDPQD